MDSSFTRKLLKWHETNQRDMPWKNTNDPYKIWLSEIILQQTRVEQGLPYYLRIIKKFPTVKHLANASQDEVLKTWEGLGYYTRARNLHVAAKQIVNDYSGKFPSDYENMLKLKGVGSYTAAAIASFAFNLPHAVLDGNVFRVLARYFGITVAVDTAQGKKIFSELAESLLDKKHAGEYNQAIMNFGATVCKPSNPECKSCIFKKECFAFTNQAVLNFPVKEKKSKIRQRWFNYLVVINKGELIIEKRNGNDIWKGLYQFPLIETAAIKDIEELKEIISRQNAFAATSGKIGGISEVIEHKLTHQTIFTRFIHIHPKAGRKFLKNESWMYVKKNDLKRYVFPKLITNYIKKTLTLVSIF